MGEDVPDSIADPYVGLDRNDKEEDGIGDGDATERPELRLFGNDIARQFCLFYRAPIQTPVATLRHSLQNQDEASIQQFHSFFQE